LVDLKEDILVVVIHSLIMEDSLMEDSLVEVVGHILIADHKVVVDILVA